MSKLSEVIKSLCTLPPWLGLRNRLRAQEAKEDWRVRFNQDFTMDSILPEDSITRKRRKQHDMESRRKKRIGRHRTQQEVLTPHERAMQVFSALLDDSMKGPTAAEKAAIQVLAERWSSPPVGDGDSSDIVDATRNNLEQSMRLDSDIPNAE